MLVDVWFIADIVINLRTGYVVEGHFVNDDLMAMRHYLAKSFLFDMVILYSPRTHHRLSRNAHRGSVLLSLGTRSYRVHVCATPHTLLLPCWRPCLAHIGCV